MEPILQCCCGVDVHKDIIEACIIKGVENSEYIRMQFSTMPDELKSFVKWLYENDCYHIAMESTGVYWRPVYEAIEDHSEYYECIMVVNAHHMRNLPGRKSDVKDAEWIASLFMHGLLKPSFVPDRIIRDLREYSRLYQNFVNEKSRYINRLEKFLQTHGFKLSSVISDIYGVSGRNILYKLSNQGFLDYEDVYQCIKGKTKRTPEEIQAAVCGKLNRPEMQLLTIILHKVDGAVADINEILTAMSELAQPYKNVLEILDSIPGIDTTAAMLILGEIGNNPQDNFERSENLCSWAGLSPRNDESAGKIKSKKILHGNPYIKSVLCQVAWAAVKTRRTPFGQWFWSHQGKLGRKKSIIAVSRKILTLIFYLIKSNSLYNPDIAMRPYSQSIET